MDELTLLVTDPVFNTSILDGEDSRQADGLEAGSTSGPPHLNSQDKGSVPKKKEVDLNVPLDTTPVVPGDMFSLEEPPLSKTMPSVDVSTTAEIAQLEKAVATKDAPAEKMALKQAVEEVKQVHAKAIKDEVVAVQEEKKAETKEKVAEAKENKASEQVMKASIEEAQAAAKLEKETVKAASASSPAEKKEAAVKAVDAKKEIAIAQSKKEMAKKEEKEAKVEKQEAKNEMKKAKQKKEIAKEAKQNATEVARKLLVKEAKKEKTEVEQKLVQQMLKTTGTVDYKKVCGPRLLLDKATGEKSAAICLMDETTGRCPTEFKPGLCIKLQIQNATFNTKTLSQDW